MKKTRIIWFTLPAFFVLTLAFQFFIKDIRAMNRIKVPLNGSYTIDGNYYDETFYFYTDIPSSYSGKVEISTDRSACSAEIDVCSNNSSCQISATPGARLNFELSSHCIGSGYVKVSVGKPSGSDDDSPGYLCGNNICETSAGETVDNCYTDCWYLDPDAGSKADGQSCSSSSQCKSGYCNNGYCCASNICCAADSNCPSRSYCGTGYICYLKWDDGAGCSEARKCKGGYCVNGKCSSSSSYCGDDYCSGSETCSSCPSDCDKCDGVSCSYGSECAGGYCNNGKCSGSPYYCGDGDCATNENCSSCPEDCGKCINASCSYNSDCESGYCVHKVCRKSSTYCGDDYCDKREKCSTCPEDCDKCDGEDCKKDSECHGGHCTHEVCRSTARYCGDGFCDGDTCENCPADCCGAELKFFLSDKRIYITPGEVYRLKLDLKNEGKGRAEDAEIKIFVTKGDHIDVSEEKIQVGDIIPDDAMDFDLGIMGKEPGKAQVIVILQGENFSGIARRLWVSVEPALNMSVPEAMYLQRQETREIGILLVNQGDTPVVADEITLESLDPSIIEVIEGSSMEIRGQGGGMEPGQVLETHTENILEGIWPEPKILAKADGKTELLAKLTYHLARDGQLTSETFEQKIPVEVGNPWGGKHADVDFYFVPKAVFLEESEARQVELVVYNRGSEVISGGEIFLIPDGDVYFETSELVEFGAIKPGQEAVAKIDIIASDEFSALLRATGRASDVSVTNYLDFKGEYQTIDGREFAFSDRMQVSMVTEKDSCEPGDIECIQAVNCLLELSNEMSCTLEMADIVPFLDKPVAVALAASDICDMSKRYYAGDDIGTAIKGIFFVVDTGDNVADLTGVGALFTPFVDAVEGAADCAEGYIYDTVDTYCAGDKGAGGYRGCADEIFRIFAQISGEDAATKEKRSYVVAVVGSPIDFSVVDNDGDELGSTDGVVVIQKGDLKFAFINNPNGLPNGFNFSVVGQSDGKYNISAALIDGGEIIATKELIDQPIKQDEDKTISVLAGKAFRSDTLEDLLLGKEVGSFRRKRFWQRLLDNISWAHLILIVSVLVFLVSIGIIFWRIKKEKKQNIHYTFWGKKVAGTETKKTRGLLKKVRDKFKRKKETKKQRLKEKPREEIPKAPKELQAVKVPGKKSRKNLIIVLVLIGVAVLGSLLIGGVLFPLFLLLILGLFFSTRWIYHKARKKKKPEQRIPKQEVYKEEAKKVLAPPLVRKEIPKKVKENKKRLSYFTFLSLLVSVVSAWALLLFKVFGYTPNSPAKFLFYNAARRMSIPAVLLGITALIYVKVTRKRRDRWWVIISIVLAILASLFTFLF